MSLTPETRITLIQRLQSGGDDAAWTEFTAIYRPVIVRLARLKGLQVADAEDLAQQVLLAVSRNISRWSPDRTRGRFRTWLQRVVRNATLNAITRRAPDQAAGGTTAMQALAANVASSDSELFDREWRRETWRWAADQVRDEFQAATWEAFWLTAIDDQSPAEVAERIGKSVGAVYIARNRVMRRLREKIAELEHS